MTERLHLYKRKHAASAPPTAWEPASTVCGWMSFLCCAMVVLAAPWFFAAWEMWYFWPFVVLLFVGLAFFCCHLFCVLRRGEPLMSDPCGFARLAVAGFVPFLVYALIRALQARVYMHAERSFLLFLTPLVLAVQMVFGFRRNQLTALYVLVMVNLFLLGAYGVINDHMTDSAHVLWRSAYEGYEGRATGTYFCPDHFSGLMELAICMVLGILLARRVAWQRKLLAASLLVLGLVGVLLSESRGGGLTVAVILATALWIGFAQWSWRARWAWRMGGTLVLLLFLVLVALTGGRYMVRFRDYPWQEIEKANRYQYTMSALRAWRTSPWVGIGPGMHQVLWPHFSATEDGDREKGKWPKFAHWKIHLYEVHNDWAQLLEEYGVVGFCLFLLAGGCTASILVVGYRREMKRREARRRHGTVRHQYAMVLGALLAVTAMGFHSLGDFNLQMPATVWLLAALVATPVALIVRAPRPQSRTPTDEPSQPIGGLEWNRIEMAKTRTQTEIDRETQDRG